LSDLTQGVPRIVRRAERRLSPWVRLVEKDVAFGAERPVETYHCLAQADYVGMLAVTPEGRLPIVRQFRPAVEAVTWEFPAGLAEPGEPPDVTCRREIREEVGLEVVETVPLGVFYADTGRLENVIHAFFVRTGDAVEGFVPEPGLEIELVTAEQLRALIQAGTFRHQLHLGLLAMATLTGLWDLGRAT